MPDEELLHISYLNIISAVSTRCYLHVPQEEIKVQRSYLFKISHLGEAGIRTHLGLGPGLLHCITFLGLCVEHCPGLKRWAAALHMGNEGCPGGRQPVPSGDVRLTPVLDARGGALCMCVCPEGRQQVTGVILLLSRPPLLNHLPYFSPSHLEDIFPSVVTLGGKGILPRC